MYGWRARIGLLIPSVNTVVEPEFSKILPEGVSIHGTRMYIELGTVDGIKRMEKDYVRAVKEIKSIKPDCIAYCCTAGSFYRGKSGDEEIHNLIQSIANAPAVTTSTSVVLALKELNLNKISVVTPYIKELNERLRRFLEENGFKVTKIEGMEMENPFEIGLISPLEVYRFAKESFSEEADGLFISCTNLRTFEVIELLEKEIGKPVVTANQATFWRSLKLAKVNEKIKGYGRLMEKS